MIYTITESTSGNKETRHTIEADSVLAALWQVTRPPWPPGVKLFKFGKVFAVTFPNGVLFEATEQKGGGK